MTEHIIMNGIRSEMEKAIQEMLYEQMLSLQKSIKLTNQAMAHALVMDPRTYFDHTKKRKDCGCLTMILLLLSCTDRDVLLEEMKKRLTNCMDTNCTKKNGKEVI